MTVIIPNMIDTVNPNLSDWVFQDKIFTEPEEITVGFVYLMTNLITGKKYIGKKNFWTFKRSQKKNKVTGKIKKTKVKIPSDWHSYFSSNDEINREQTEGTIFKREILHLCHSKAEMTYWETKLQFQYDVLLSDEFYNAWIMCRVRKSHLKKVKL